MKLSAPIYQLKRRAKLMARNEKNPLHTALDRIARDEGFAGWSLLSARVATCAAASEMLSRLSDGDMLLLGARPGHGKTLLGLQLLLDAIRDGRRGVFFTLEYTEQETHARIRSLEGESSGLGAALEIVTSDEICADYIMRHLADASPGTVAVIDYLQILDQRRNKPELSEQITTLQKFARKTGIILAFISQIDRSYDPEAKPLPDMQDIRLPNKVDVGLFSKACFLHEGKAQFRGAPSNIRRRRKFGGTCRSSAVSRSVRNRDLVHKMVRIPLDPPAPPISRHGPIFCAMATHSPPIAALDVQPELE